MPINKESKKLIVQELEDELKESSGIVLTDYKGLDVQKINQLRNELREKKIKYKVYKNTLIQLAAKETDLEEFSNNLSGCTAIAFSKDEPILTVKILHQFSRENKEIFRLKRALIEGKIFFEDQLEKIANLPSKEELLSLLLGNLKSPINTFVYILKSPIAGLINVINQIKEQKEKVDA